MAVGTGPDSPVSTDVQLILKVYGWLRGEINESYRRQHQLVVGQATLIGLAIGLQFGFDFIGGSTGGSGVAEFLRFAFMAIPPLVLVTASLWLLEHNRVMRAGNYLQLLEFRINDRVDGNPLSWETWLRDPPSRPLLERIRSPHFVFNVCHFIGYPAFFVAMEVVSMALVAKWVYAVPVWDVHDASVYLELLVGRGLGTAAYFLVLSTALLLVVGFTVSQIPHGWQDQSDRFRDFEIWLHKQFDGSADQSAD